MAVEDHTDGISLDKDTDSAVTDDAPAPPAEVAPAAEVSSSFMVATFQSGDTSGGETVAADPAPIITLASADGAPTVNPKEKFNALGEEEFASLFKMSRVEFKKLPNWKQVNAKKEVKLF